MSLKRASLIGRSGKSTSSGFEWMERAFVELTGR